MGWTPIFLTWLSELPDYLKEQTPLIRVLFEWTLPPLFTLVRKKLKEYIVTQDIQLAIGVMRILSMLFKDATSDENSARDCNKNVKNWIIVSFCCVWAVQTLRNVSKGVGGRNFV